MIKGNLCYELFLAPWLLLHSSLLAFLDTLSMPHVIKLIRLINQHHQMEPISFHSSRLVIPDWPFGYTHARLVLKNGKRVIIKQTFDIADDGAKATINSWNVDWKDTSVEVVISGTEQDDVLYVLKFDGSVDRKQLDTRYGHIKEERTGK